jgi:hypothetical protein
MVCNRFGAGFQELGGGHRLKRERAAATFSLAVIFLKCVDVFRKVAVDIEMNDNSVIRGNPSECQADN